MNIFTGSPLYHPKSRYVTTYHGSILQQSFAVAEALRRLISGQATKLSQTTIPFEMKLHLDHGVIVKGTLMTTTVVVARDRFMRFVLASWDKTVFNILLVTFNEDDSISVEHHQNPPDVSMIHKPAFEAIMAPS